jgi:hypothetical protein
MDLGQNKQTTYNRLLERATLARYQHIDPYGKQAFETSKALDGARLRPLRPGRPGRYAVLPGTRSFRRSRPPGREALAPSPELLNVPGQSSTLATFTAPRGPVVDQ